MSSLLSSFLCLTSFVIHSNRLSLFFIHTYYSPYKGAYWHTSRSVILSVSTIYFIYVIKCRQYQSISNGTVIHYNGISSFYESWCAHNRQLQVSVLLLQFKRLACHHSLLDRDVVAACEYRASKKLSFYRSDLVMTFHYTRVIFLYCLFIFHYFISLKFFFTSVTCTSFSPPLRLRLFRVISFFHIPFSQIFPRSRVH